MARTVILYALALGVGTTVLNWLQYRYLARALSSDLYLALLAAGFAVLGMWMLRALAVQYRHPLFRMPMTFAEIFPVGLIIALVSAGLLRNPRLLPAQRPAG
jgi:hypothetical protein